MVAARKTRDESLLQIVGVLQRFYAPSHPAAEIDAYRYNPASIRIRIIDKEFSGVLLTRRGASVWKCLEDNLSEKVFSEIGLLILIAPDESEMSVANQEFEYPTPTPGSIGWARGMSPKPRPRTPTFKLGASKNQSSNHATSSRKARDTSSS